MDALPDNPINSNLQSEIQVEALKSHRKLRIFFVVSSLMILVVSVILVTKFIDLDIRKYFQKTSPTETKPTVEEPNPNDAFETLVSQSNNTETTKPSATEVSIKTTVSSTVANNTIKTPEPAPLPTKSTPDNNDNPSIELISFGYKDKTFSEDDPIYLSVRASDNIGGISSVKFYINGEKEKTIEYRNLYKSDTSGWDPGTADRGIRMASDYLEDKYSDDITGYTYRSLNKFDTTKSSCGFSEAYIFIMQGKNNQYDVRMTKNLDDIDVCYKGTVINYNDKYIYLFNGDGGDYEFYAEAVDIYGASKKSETVEFEID